MMINFCLNQHLNRHALNWRAANALQRFHMLGVQILPWGHVVCTIERGEVMRYVVRGIKCFTLKRYFS